MEPKKDPRGGLWVEKFPEIFLPKILWKKEMFWNWNKFLEYKRLILDLPAYLGFCYSLDRIRSFPRSVHFKQ